MEIIQTTIQTLWAAVLALGWVKVIIAVVIISLLSKFQPWLGFLAFVFFVAYLLNWIHF